MAPSGPAAVGTGRPVSVETYHAVTQWLFGEARILDDGRLDEWLDLVTEDFEYRLPVAVVRRRGDDRRGTRAAYALEDRASLRIRADRLHTEFNWSEDPGSFTRRHLSNVVVTVLPSDEKEQYEAEYALLLVRCRGTEAQPELLSGLRRDTLVRQGDGFLLRSRHLDVDHSVLGVRNMPFPP